MTTLTTHSRLRFLPSLRPKRKKSGQMRAAAHCHYVIDYQCDKKRARKKNAGRTASFGPNA